LALLGNRLCTASLKATTVSSEVSIAKRRSSASTTMSSAQRADHDEEERQRDVVHERRWVVSDAQAQRKLVLDVLGSVSVHVFAR
jgi:hypothetical protein